MYRFEHVGKFGLEFKRLETQRFQTCPITVFGPEGKKNVTPPACATHEFERHPTN